MSEISSIGSNTDVFINNIWKSKTNKDDKKEMSIKQEVQTKANINSEKETPLKEEVQTETFVNSKGEKIVAIKTPFGGFRYIKIGEIDNSLLSDNKTSIDVETLDKAKAFTS